MKRADHRQSPLWRGCALALAAAMLSGCATVARPRAERLAPTFEAMRKRLSADCAAGAFSGVVAVERQGRLIFEHHCGRADAAGSPLGPSARFRLYSITKTFTATAILKLVELRRLRLEATLAELAPNIPSEWKDVTVAQLLHHQSGIADHTEKLLEAYRSGGSRSHEAAMRRLLESLKEPDKSLQFAPGGQWRYSNFGYELLAYAAASAEKRPFREIVRDHVFKPAGMSTAELEAADPNSAALRPLPLLGLAQGFNGVAGQPKPIGPVYSLIQQGAGATVAGYKDVLAFTRALGRGRLLSPAMLARNEGDSVAINETLRYGYGWMIAQAQGCTYWEHSGGTNGYVSDMIYAPDAGLTLVILSNFGFAPISDYRRDFLQALLTQGACKAGG